MSLLLLFGGANQAPTQQVTLTANGTGTASMVRNVRKNLTYNATGAASVVKSVSKGLSATGTGTSTILSTRVKLVDLIVTGTGTAIVGIRTAKQGAVRVAGLFKTGVRQGGRGRGMGSSDAQ